MMFWIIDELKNTHQNFLVLEKEGIFPPHTAMSRSFLWKRLRQIWGSMNQNMKEPDIIDSSPRTLFSFNSPASLKDWTAVSDVVIGGKSTAKIEYDEENKMGVFSGNLSLELKEDSTHTKTGYGALVSETFLLPRRLEKHNCFELDLETDGRTYVMNVTPIIMGDTALMYQSSFKIEPNQLSTVSIPFSTFALTRDGLIVDDQRPLCKDTKIHRVGFIMAERKEGPFSLKLKEIRSAKMMSSRYDPDACNSDDD